MLIIKINFSPEDITDTRYNNILNTYLRGKYLRYVVVIKFIILRRVCRIVHHRSCFVEITFNIGDLRSRFQLGRRNT